MVVVISLFLIGSANAHKQTMHQHITREAFDLLQMSFPGQLSEMESYVGNNEVWSGGSADGSFGALNIVSGAWLEDEYDVVYHYGILKKPDYNQIIPASAWLELYDDWTEEDISRKAHTSITHFWNADNGENTSTFLHDNTNILVVPYWSFTIPENAIKKMRKYVNGDYEFLWAYRNEIMSWSWCGMSSLHVMTKFSIPGVIDFYNAQEDFQAIRYFGEDGNWNYTNCPNWDTSFLAFHKAHAYEILGRMCHLIQDMSVPAHVHCTSHAGTGGMYSDYYENNARNFYMWTADEIYNQGGQFICPFNNVNDPIFYLMYFMNQIADHYADGKHNGDNNYDVNIPGLSEIIPYLGAPTNTSEINESNCQSMHDVLMQYAIRTTAGLLYWFGIETGTLVDDPPAIPQNFNGSWYNNHPKIYWTANSEPDFDYYEVWKYMNSNWSLKTTTTSTFYIDYGEIKYTGNPQIKRRVKYRVCAVDNASQKSDYTPEKTFVVGGFPLMEKRSESDSTIISGLSTLPQKFNLLPPAPNPFNVTTTIKLELPEETRFSLVIYNIKGEEVWSLNNKHINTYPTGYHTIRWEGKDNFGSMVSTGVYIIVFTSPKHKLTQKVVLMK